MFLTKPLPKSIRIIPKSGEDTPRNQWNSPEKEKDRNGVLGFDLKLFSSSRSVDEQQWNLPTQWDASIINSSLLQKRRTEVDQSWLPWIPTLGQIQSLKRPELQHACRQRNLSPSGLKADLQDRLVQWSKEEEKRQLKLQESCQSMLEGISTFEPPLPDTRPSEKPKEQENKESANSLAEWARTVDLEPLFNRREKIHREKNQGKPKKKDKDADSMPRDELLDALARVYDKPSSPYSNKQVKTMYSAAKKADQAGDRALAKRILEELLVATPHDTRLYRRLARMHNEEGQVSKARAVLEEGLRNHPNNAYLWHGLGRLSDTPEEAVDLYKKAIVADPAFPNAHHALGTLQHDRGEIAKAMKTIKAGLIECPTNHRLHHALADLYRDAKMLEMAVKEYKNAIYYGPKISHGFSYSGLAYCAYEQDDIEECRRWLRQAVTLNPRQASAWVSLAQMEEATGNVEEGLKVCAQSIDWYERDLLKRSRDHIKTSTRDSETKKHVSSVTLKNEFLQQVPPQRSGDRFFQVYRNWARMEAEHGSPDSVEDVYQRAVVAFPKRADLFNDWADYCLETGCSTEKIKGLLQQAADVSQDGHSHQKLGMFMMQRGDHKTARKLLYLGATAVGGRTDDGLPELYLTWAVCEWRLGELGRAEHLLDHAMRLTTSSSMRSFLLYGIARLEYARGEFALSQHCIGLALKESFPRKWDQRAVWKLWVKVATAMGNDNLAQQCRDQAALLAEPTENTTKTSVNMEDFTRREPWSFEIFGATGKTQKWNRGVNLPSLVENAER